LVVSGQNLVKPPRDPEVTTFHICQIWNVAFSASQPENHLYEEKNDVAAGGPAGLHDRYGAVKKRSSPTAATSACAGNCTPSSTGSATTATQTCGVKKGNKGKKSRSATATSATGSEKSTQPTG
jgi:hypothetical protein